MPAGPTAEMNPNALTKQPCNHYPMRGFKSSGTASKFEREKLFQNFKTLLDQVNYPDHKRENTEILFRRLLGRATPNKWEFHTLMGVFRSASNRIEREKARNIKISKTNNKT